MAGTRWVACWLRGSNGDMYSLKCRCACSLPEVGQLQMIFVHVDMECDICIQATTSLQAFHQTVYLGVVFCL